MRHLLMILTISPRYSIDRMFFNRTSGSINFLATLKISEEASMFSLIANPALNYRQSYTFLRMASRFIV